MTVKSTSLVFTTNNQSLWTEGTSPELRIDTGNLLQVEASVTRNFNANAYITSVSGQLYFDFLAGFRAYVELERTGSFDAAYNFNVNVDFESAIDITVGDPALPPEIGFDFSDWSPTLSKLSSTGFSSAGSAGLEFGIFAEAGLRNGYIDYPWPFSGDTFSFSLFPSVNKNYQIIGIDTTDDPELTFEVGDSTITIRLPAGADTTGFSYGDLAVTSSGNSDTSFLDIDIDVDELITELKSLIEELGGDDDADPLPDLEEPPDPLDFLFLDETYDLGDYVGFIPKNKIKFGAMMLDITANIDAYLTEDLSLEVTNQTAPVSVVLRSDNGTPTDFSDDKVAISALGASTTIEAPTVDKLNLDPLSGISTGTATITAYYDLAPVDYSHTFGIGLSGSLKVDAFSGFLSGPWVPSSLAGRFGPLLSVTIPDEALTTGIDIYTDSFQLADGSFANTPSSGTDPSTWNYQQGAFNQVTETYEVFVTDSSPPGWDASATKAVQQVYAYRDALQQNAISAIAAFADLSDSPQNASVTLTSAPVELSGGNHTYLWQGNVTTKIQLGDGEGQDNHVNISPGVPGEVLSVNFVPLGTDFGPLENAEKLFLDDLAPGASVDQIVDLLDALADPQAAIVYSWGSNELRSVNGVSIIGQDGADLLVQYRPDPAALDPDPRLFDGGDGRDIFVANYLASDPDTAIEFSTVKDGFADGIRIGDNTTIRNVESFFLRTGNADDYVSSGITTDYFETSGGDDFIFLYADLASDSAFAGAGDDVIFVSYNKLEPAFGERGNLDFTFGGPGADLGVFRTEEDPSAPNFQPELATELFIYVFGNDEGQQVFYDYTIETMFYAMDIYNSGNYKNPNIGLDWDASTVASLPSDFNREKLSYSSPAGSAWFYSDVEAVSFIGSDFSNDVAIFSGGLTYDGGEGKVVDPASDLPGRRSDYSNVDTLFGDFGAYENQFNVTTGLFLVAEDRIGVDPLVPETRLSFGDATIEGFERFVARGTQFDDYFLGGRFDDGFEGGDGNDIIDGGEFEPFVTATYINTFGQTSFEAFTVSAERDILRGGAGDDTFYWSDDGADIIDGGADDDTLIIEAEGHSQSLNYALFDYARFYPDDAFRSIFLASNSSTEEIATGLGLFRQDVVLDNYSLETGGFVVGPGLRFGDSPLAGRTISGAVSNSGPVYGSGHVSDGIDLGDPWLHYLNIEHVNITASDDWGDLLIYQGGATYIAGEKADGTDRDTFAADFSAQTIGIEFAINQDDATGQFLQNGVFVQGAERAIILGGTGNDLLVGGLDRDYLDGGDGADRLYGGDDYLSPIAEVNFVDDVLRGGAGDDIALWFGDGRDEFDGGDGNDTAVIASRGGSLTWTGVDYLGLLFNGPKAIDSFSNLEGAFRYGNLQDASRYMLAGIIDPLNPSGDLTSFKVSNVESANIVGSDDFNDVVLYLDGLINYGGERVGDIDLFIANLSEETVDLTITASDQTDGPPVSGSGTGEFDDEVNYLGELADLQDIGNGSFIGGFERLYVSGGSGDDVISGGALPDKILGGSGNDRLDVGTGGGNFDGYRDEAEGGTGDDVLTYRGDHAVLDGGILGYDTLEFEVDPSGVTSGFTVTVLERDLNYGAPSDYLEIATYDASAGRAELTALFLAKPATAGQINIDAGSGAHALRIDYPDGTLIHRDFEKVTFEGTASGDMLIGMRGSSSLFGNSGSDVLLSGIGNDVLAGGSGLDIYAFDSGNGGFGDDIIAMEAFQGGTLYFNDKNQADVAFSVFGLDDLKITTAGGTILIQDYFGAGGNGFDFTFDFLDFTGKIDLSGLPGITASPGTVGNTYVGTAAPDNFSSTDTATFFTDNDDIYHGLASGDIFVGSNGADLFNGGPGSDSVNYLENGGASGVTVDLTARIGSGGLALGDIFISIENVIGTDNADFLSGDEADNILFGQGGIDTILGGVGKDTLIGNAGNDTLDGESEDDELFGDEGEDVLAGSNGNDFLSGGTGNDSLDGGDHDDVLIGGAGVDTAMGGAGNDIYLHGGEDLASTLDVDENGEDIFDGGADTDMLDLSTYEFAIGLGDTVGAIVTNRTETFTGLIPASVGVMTYSNVEEFIGTRFGDRFIDTAGHSYAGEDGDDMFIVAGLAGVFSGDDGWDTLSENKGDVNGQIIDLSSPVKTFTDTAGVVHVVESIEHFIGSDNDDDFVGDMFNNMFSDGDGADIFEGFGGNDTVIAGVNAFTLYDDEYYGDAGFDKIDYSTAVNGIELDLQNEIATDLGLSGDAGSIGFDIVAGFEHGVTGSGDDVLFGTQGDDILDAGAGDDDVSGDAGDDRIIGGLGNDVYDGEGGFDTVDYSRILQSITLDLTKVTWQASGAGIDSDSFSSIEAFVAGQGSDNFLGSIGDDNFIYSSLRGTGGLDLWDGNDGTDTADFSKFNAAVRVDLTAAVEVSTRDAGNMLEASGTLRDIADLTSIEKVILTRFSDELLGSNAGDILEGQGGGDVFVGRDGADTFFGGAGSDTVDYSQEIGSLGILADFTGTTLSALGSLDTFGQLDLFNSIENVIGSNGDDIIFGAVGPYIFDGADGNDVIMVYGGNNILLGGVGNDTIGSGAGNDFIDGGFGSDTVIYSGLGGAIAVDLSLTGMQETGAGGIDVLDGIENLIGGDFDDLLAGNDQNNELSGGSGNDMLVGGAGDDQYDGGSDADTITYERTTQGVVVNLLAGTASGAEIGSDTLANIENVIGGSGNDTITGNGNANLLEGRGGNDTLTAIGGNGNILRGGEGDDALIGGFGNDVQLQGNGGADSFTGGTGADDFYIDALDISFDGGGGYDRLIVVDTNGVNVALAGTNMERTIGGSGNDVFDGTGVATTLVMSGLGGNDTLTGSSAADQLSGGEDNDLLNGGSGDDFLFGDGGSDSFVGGAGDDRFFADSTDASFIGGSGFDRIFILDTGNFAFALTGSEVERVNGNDGNDALDATGVSDDVILAGNGGNDTLTGGDGNDVVAGGDGVDIIDGGAGTDSYFGGLGADIFVFNADSGFDYIADWEDGVDIIDFSGNGNVLLFSDLTISNTGANTRIQFDGGDTILVFDSIGEIEEADFVFV